MSGRVEADEQQWKGAAHFVDTSPEKLRARRTHALAMAAEAEEKAEEARRQAEVYSQAARALEQKAFGAEAILKSLEATGDEDAARAQRESFDHLRKLIQQNYAKADEKGEIAVVFAREAFRERDYAARLKDELSKKA